MSEEFIETITAEEGRRRIARYEDQYPDFAMIYGDFEMPSCCKADAVAERYGWGDATNDWTEYAGLRWLMEGL